MLLCDYFFFRSASTNTLEVDVDQNQPDEAPSDDESIATPLHRLTKKPVWKRHAKKNIYQSGGTLGTVY